MPLQILSTSLFTIQQWDTATPVQFLWPTQISDDNDNNGSIWGRLASWWYQRCIFKRFSVDTSWILDLCKRPFSVQDDFFFLLRWWWQWWRWWWQWWWYLQTRLLNMVWPSPVFKLLNKGESFLHKQQGLPFVLYISGSLGIFISGSLGIFFPTLKITIIFLNEKLRSQVFNYIRFILMAIESLLNLCSILFKLDF